jgi:kanamycin kinase/aminoglycoside 3'-phosphotransferase-2
VTGTVTVKPARLPEFLARAHPGVAEPISLGRTAAAVWRVAGTPARYLKVVGDGNVALARELRAEAEHAVWLRAQGFPAPEVLDAGSRDGVSWLVTAAVPGRTMADPWPASMRDRLVDNLADICAALHEIPVTACPFRRDLAVTIPAAADAVRAGAVDADDFDEERAGRTASDLLAELLATRPDTEDLVVCHGDLCLPNVLADPETGTITGLIDLGRLGVADRHQDLALATRSLGPINGQYGPDAAGRLLRRYPLPADPRLLAYYRLLDEFF